MYHIRYIHQHDQFWILIIWAIYHHLPRATCGTLLEAGSLEVSSCFLVSAARVTEIYSVCGTLALTSIPRRFAAACAAGVIFPMTCADTPTACATERSFANAGPGGVWYM